MAVSVNPAHFPPYAQPPAGVVPVVRFRNPEAGQVVVEDLVHGRVIFENSELCRGGGAAAGGGGAETGGFVNWAFIPPMLPILERDARKRRAGARTVHGC